VGISYLLLFFENRKGDIFFLAKEYSKAFISFNLAISKTADRLDFLGRKCSTYEKLELWSDVVSYGTKLLERYPSYALGNYIHN
jgi:hypothetical protein